MTSLFSDIFSADNLQLTEPMVNLIVSLAVNSLVTWIIVHFFYYPKGHRRDYYFTFILLSVSIFMLISLLLQGSSDMGIGAALGLFAIFGIVRYRTEQMPVREMSYLFVIISLSVINGLSQNITIGQTIVANLLLITAIWATEQEIRLKDVRSKLIAYDDVSKIRPEQRDELIADLQERTGLSITQVEVGHVDFLRDMAMLRVFYVADATAPQDNEIESLTKFPKSF